MNDEYSEYSAGPLSREPERTQPWSLNLFFFLIETPRVKTISPFFYGVYPFQDIIFLRGTSGWSIDYIAHRHPYPL
jgi:hypothetical protein